MATDYTDLAPTCLLRKATRARKTLKSIRKKTQKLLGKKHFKKTFGFYCILLFHNLILTLFMSDNKSNHITM